MGFIFESWNLSCIDLGKQVLKRLGIHLSGSLLGFNLCLKIFVNGSVPLKPLLQVMTLLLKSAGMLLQEILRHPLLLLLFVLGSRVNLHRRYFLSIYLILQITEHLLLREHKLALLTICCVAIADSAVSASL